MMGKLKGMLGREKKKEGDEADAVPADEEAKAGAPPSLAPVGGAAGIAAEADDEEVRIRTLCAGARGTGAIYPCIPAPTRTKHATGTLYIGVEFYCIK